MAKDKKKVAAPVVKSRHFISHTDENRSRRVERAKREAARNAAKKLAIETRLALRKQWQADMANRENGKEVEQWLTFQQWKAKRATP